MRYFAFLAFLAIGLPGFSQKILVNQKDKFTGKQVISTNYINLKQSLSDVLQVKLISADTTQYVIFRGKGWGTGIISPTDPLIILLQNDSSVTMYPSSLQDVDISMEGSYYNHQYIISRDQLDALARHPIKSMRKYYNSVHKDLDIPQRNEDGLQKLCAVFKKAAL